MTATDSLATTTHRFAFSDCHPGVEEEPPVSAAKKLRSVKLRQAVQFEVTPVPFVPFQSLRTLDLDRLARARHTVVELGQFESERCKRTVRAVIKAGQVSEVKVDPCRDAKARVPPAFAKLVARAHAKLKRSTSSTPRLPIPVASFFARNSNDDIVIVIDLSQPICYTVCIDFSGLRFCSTCCVGITGPINCGSVFFPPF
jgi:hypothetical protein